MNIHRTFFWDQWNIIICFVLEEVNQTYNVLYSFVAVIDIRVTFASQSGNLYALFFRDTTFSLECVGLNSTQWRIVFTGQTWDLVDSRVPPATSRRDFRNVVNSKRYIRVCHSLIVAICHPGNDRVNRMIYCWSLLFDQNESSRCLLDVRYSNNRFEQRPLGLLPFRSTLRMALVVYFLLATISRRACRKSRLGSRSINLRC